MIIVKRDPVAVGAAIISVLGFLGAFLDWSPVLTAALIGVVTAGVAVIQAANVFGTDQFTAVAVNLVGAALGCLLAFGLNVADDVQTAILAAVPILLGLFARNGVTNRYGVDGSLTPALGGLTP